MEAQKRGFLIRRAHTSEAERLTEVSFSSKRYWDYPEEYLTIWHDELTISADYIQKHAVYVLELDRKTAGYYSLVVLPEDLHLEFITIKSGLWLEHMFLDPAVIGRGWGKKLFIHCVDSAARYDHTRLRILADPNAKGFYSKMGCIYIKEYPSTIEGRTTPYLEFSLPGKDQKNGSV